MKYIILVVCSAAVIFVIFRLTQINYASLSAYGKGFLAGNLFLIAIFSTIIIIVIRKIRNQNISKGDNRAK